MNRQSTFSKSVGTRKKQYKKTYKAAYKAGKYKAKKGNMTYRKAYKTGSKAGAMKRAVRNPIPGCASDYLAAQYNPWAEFPRAPCIPDQMAMPSAKQSYRIRASFTIGEQGTGFITLNPYSIQASNPTVGYVPGLTNGDFLCPVFYTTAAYPNTGVDIYNYRLITPPVGSPGIVGANWNSPWSGDLQVQNVPYQAPLEKVGNLAWRPVAAGIKVKFAGNVMNRKGTVVLFNDPNNDGMLDRTIPSSQAALLGLEESAFTSVTEDEYNVVYRPRTNNDFQYSDQWRESVQALARFDVLMIAVFGANPGDEFAFDVIGHYELIGSHVPNRTSNESHIDLVGKINAIMPKKPSLFSPARALGTAYNRLQAAVEARPPIRTGSHRSQWVGMSGGA